MEDFGLMLTDFGIADRDEEVAGGIEAEALDAGEGEMNLARVGPGRDDEIVFQVVGISVEDGVDTGVDVAVADLAEERDVMAPVLGIVAEEVVGLAGDRFFWLDFRSSATTFEVEAENSVAGAKDGFVSGEPQRGGRAAGQVADLRVGLATVRFESKR
jgi:hypothetical protein